jgi:hypothetical protein
MQKFELTSPNAFIRRAAVVDDPALVNARLKELHPDLKSILFMNAIRGGLGARNDVTRASAATAAGVQQWLKTVEDLRTLLAALQWHIHEQKNCPFISSPDHSVSLVVMTGNSETGKNSFADPTNQAEKGAVAATYVQQNHQLELFNHESFTFAKDNQKETRVWALLYHYDKALNEVRFELSLPTGFNNKKITEWGVRLILGSIPNNPANFTIHKDDPIAPVTVEVEPRTGSF